MTATELTYDIPYNPLPRPPKPQACREPTVARFTVTASQEVWGEDRTVEVMRSCGHVYFYSSRHGDPAIGSEAMNCAGPQVETAESGRGDKSVAPLKKGKRWTRMPEKVA